MGRTLRGCQLNPAVWSKQDVDEIRWTGSKKGAAQSTPLQAQCLATPTSAPLTATSAAAVSCKRSVSIESRNHVAVSSPV